MLLHNDPKHIATIIVAGKLGKGEHGEASGDSEMSTEDHALHAAGQEVIKAIKEGEAHEFVDAFKTMYDLCYSASASKDDEGEGVEGSGD